MSCNFAYWPEFFILTYVAYSLLFTFFFTCSLLDCFPCTIDMRCFPGFHMAAGVFLPVLVGTRLPVAQTAGVVISVDLTALEGLRTLRATNAGFIIGCLCRAGRVVRLVFVGRNLLIVGVGSITVLFGIVGHIAAICSALMPVVGLILAPCSCLAVGVRRACCQLQLFLAVIVTWAFSSSAKK